MRSGNPVGTRRVPADMPGLSPLEPVALFAFLAVLAALVSGVVWVARRAWDGGESHRVRKLEQRVRELEGRD